jgi:DUF438 domain-containing protein
MEERIRLQKLAEVFYAIYHGRYGLQMIRQNEAWLNETTPSDIVRLVDMLVKNNIPMAGLKTGINKFLNVVHKQLLNRENPVPPPDSLLDFCIRNNDEMDRLLKAVRPSIKGVNKNPSDPDVRSELQKNFSVLGKYGAYYQIKENVLFPLLEKHWKEHRCVRVMWSFHDDIRKNLQQINSMLEEETLDLARFNRLTGDVFFNMYAIRFREEKILFPLIMESIPEETVNALLRECARIGFPFVQPEIPEEERSLETPFPGVVDMESGKLTPEQIMLIFNNLPVDITFVDENDQLTYYSTPPDRIFVRTNAALGRDVRNCHPPESMHIVEEILDTFRKGERDSATFWLNMKGEKVLIQYFACRDKEGNYKGVIEVSQVISGIQSLTGEKRLLDWKR